jgi:hypothetical protein
MMAQFSAWWSWLRAGAIDAVTAWWPWLLAVAVLYGAWWLWWRLPKRQMRSITAADQKARADIEDNFRKTIGQLLGGAAVLIGAGFAYLQFTQQQRASREQFSEQQRAAQEQFTRQQKTAQQQLDEQQQASRELLVSNQVSKGFEQLGSDKPVVRLGGIYALEGVMNTSERYHQPVLEALCAFVRDATRTVKGNGPPATDIQAALTVIRRREVAGQQGHLYLGYLDLTHVRIPKAYLSGANLGGAEVGVWLSGANLIGTNLSHAILADADLSGALLGGANLSGAKLHGAHLNDATLIVWAGPTAVIHKANLTDADLRGTNITQAQLDQACGTHVMLDPGLTLNKPCPQD